MMTYDLVKNHYFCTDPNRPVLTTGGDHVGGPFDRNYILPGCTDSTYHIVMRALAGEPLPNDPRIGVEEGGDRFTYMTQFLGLTEADFQHAELICRIGKLRKKNEAGKREI